MLHGNITRYEGCRLGIYLFEVSPRAYQRCSSPGVADVRIHTRLEKLLKEAAIAGGRNGQQIARYAGCLTHTSLSWKNLLEGKIFEFHLSLKEDRNRRVNSEDDS